MSFNGATAGHPRDLAYSFSDATNPDASMQDHIGSLDPAPFSVMVFGRFIPVLDDDIFAVGVEK